MKKKEIGILTFWDVPNYGTFAQAYALQKCIESLSKIKTSQIAHLDSHHYNYYFNKHQYYREMRLINYRRWKYLFVQNKTQLTQREENFRNAYLNIPNTTIESINSNDENIVFLGSDIIWDFSHEQFNNDKYLFGIGLNCEVNAYAASFGTVKAGRKIPQYVIEGIKKMNHISVRDANSADIVESITGKRPEVVLDPVWMWDFVHDSNIKKPLDQNYIVVYGQDFTDEFITNLIRYAKDNEKMIIALDCNEDNYEWCDKLIKQDELDPYLWIGYFLNADAIATSTFHGLTFGLLFNKRIAFCKTDFILAKVKNLLEELDILKIFEDRNNVKYMMDYNWDYENINRIINEKRKNSARFLQESLR